MKNIYDITTILSENTPIFDGDEPFKKIDLADIDRDGFKTSLISMTTHTGTHIDSPAHFLKNGKTLDQYPPEKFCGRGHVISSHKLDLYIHNIFDEDIIIFSDDNLIEFDDDFLNFLKNKKIKIIGTKGLSLEYNPPFKLHQFFLSNDILLLEGLNLDNIQEGIYYIMAMPLLIKNSDAAPARVFIFREEISLD
ncbi:cyclase family protein [bacterium]|nr:cyclase family protein [bacterium]